VADEPEVSGIYRDLHAAPMVGWLPAPWFFGLLVGGALATFLTMAVLGKIAGCFALVGVGSCWGCCAYVYAQDRVWLPLKLIKRRLRISRRISSYAPSRRRLVIRKG
jgi:hypothetical protein